MAVKNQTILEKAWLEGTNDFQQRIPDPSQAGMEATIKALFDPMNQKFYNEFIDTLVNRIGMTIVRNSKWDNPLKAFKGGKLNFGSTIQELIPRWLKAHNYKDDIETLLKMNRPSLEQAFHTLNRQDRYDITINHEELRMAFTEEFGLNNLVSALLQTPYNSDAYDEYRCMVQLIGKYERNFGFYKHHLDSMPIDEKSGKEFLKVVREYIGKLRFPSTVYNARKVKGVPVFAKPEELVLLLTPEVNASLSVEVLASLFHVEKAQLEVKIVMVDEFPIPDAVALLTTKDWYVAHDKEYLVNNFYNPQTLSINYYLHHWEILSCSPFVPAILFTLGKGTEVDTITQVVNGLQISAEKLIAEPGEKVMLFPNLLGTFGDTDDPKPEAACTYELTYNKTVMSTRTYVDRNNLLHIQSNAIDGDILHVKATSTYHNPSINDETEFTAEIDIQIGKGGGGDIFLINPLKEVILTDTETNNKHVLEMRRLGDKIVEFKDKIYHVPQYEAYNTSVIKEDYVDKAVVEPVISEEAQGASLVFEDVKGHDMQPPFTHNFIEENPMYFDCFDGDDISESKWACIVNVRLKLDKTIKPKINSFVLSKKDTKCYAEAYNIVSAPIGQMGSMQINKAELMGEQLDLDATFSTDITGQDDMLYIAQDDKMEKWEPYVPGSVNTQDKRNIGVMVVQVGKDDPIPANWYAYNVQFMIYNDEKKSKKRTKKPSKRN